MAVTINGSTGVEYDDGVKLILGTGDDLELYHSSDQNYIYSTNGRINLRASEVRCEKADGSEVLAKFIADGACELRYDDSAKFKTASYGTLQNNGNFRLPDGTTADAGWGRIQFGSGQDLQIFHDGTDSRIDNSTGALILRVAGTEKAIACVPDGQVELYHNNVNKFMTTSTGAYTAGQLDINNSTANAVGDLDDPADYGLVLRGSSTTGEGTGIAFTNDDKSAVGSAICHIDNGSNNIGHLVFYTSASSNTPTEKLRIGQDGTITTNGNTSVPTGSTSGFGFTEDQFYISGSGSSDNYQIRFYNSNGLVGSCMTSGSSTSYNTSSDYRLKENIISLTGAITRIKELSPKRFNFKANASKTVDGFLAHEAQTVVPEAVSGTKDAVDSDDKIMPQGIDQSKLVPLLTAALQEAIAKIETLETKVAALEAA